VRACQQRAPSSSSLPWRKSSANGSSPSEESSDAESE